MNICLLPSAKMSYESGSTLYAQNCVYFLTERGHTVYVLCSELPSSLCENAHYILLNIVEHPVIDDYIVEDYILNNSIRLIVRKIIELNDSGIKFDIIHAHYATINAMAAQIIKIFLGIPYIVSCFGRDVFNGFENDDRYKKMVLSSIAYSNHTIASNNAVLERISSFGLIDESNISILSMPVNNKIFMNNNKSRTHMNNNKFILLNVVSCLANEKGIQTTLEAVKILKSSQKYLFKLYIVGMDEHPDKRNQKKYESYIRDNCLQDNVEMIGQIPNNQIPLWLAKANVLIDSRYVGNYSSVILEALSFGKAIIASDVAGNKEFILDGYNGLLYQKGNPFDLVGKINYIWNDTKNIHILENNAKSWFDKNKKKYSFPDHASQLETIYRQIISS